MSLADISNGARQRINQIKPYQQRHSVYIYPVASLLWATFIFFVSIAPIPVKPVSFPFLDKLVHLIEYVIMGYLFARSKLKLSLVIILGALHGLSCEFAQSFTQSRQAELMDLVSDITGTAIGLWLALFHSRLSFITRIK